VTGGCFDSVILIDLINGRPEARRLVETTDPRQRVISVLTRTEVLTGTRSTDEQQRALLLLDRFINVDTTAIIADAAAQLRQQHRLKTPDAIIAATAAARGLPLFTRDVGLAALPGAQLAY
jgi:predicted nucleic acid-binding protein